MNGFTARDGELILLDMEATIYILLFYVSGVAARHGEVILWGMKGIVQILLLNVLNNGKT